MTSKKHITDTIPPPAPLSPEEKEDRMEHFLDGLKASCLESLHRSGKETSWRIKFFDRDNAWGALCFILVWLCGGITNLFTRYHTGKAGNTTLLECLRNRDHLLFLIVLALFLVFFAAALNAPWKHTRAVPKIKEYLLVSLLLVLEFTFIFAIVSSPSPLFKTEYPWQVIAIVPLALFPAILINLLDARTAVCTAILEAILLPFQVTTLQAGDEYRLFCFAMIITITAIPCFKEIRFRIHYITRGAMLGAILVLLGFLFCYFTRTRISADQMKKVAFLGMSQGILVGLICMIILPLLEVLFRLPTLMTLSELTDVNAPLLQRLRNEAPGTYQHSLDVAEMATNAASLIGADAKLVNVMGLYHDVGKLFAPQYFAENMTGDHNPLENSLRPEESANLIFEHTTHGVQLATKYHISPLIVPAIRQHHGNTLLEHFYKKACSEADAQGRPHPSEDDFRYPQKPTSSREVAILSLADSCEAAVRALLGAKPDLNQLAQKIVAGTRDAGSEAAEKCADILADSMKGKDPASIIRAIDERIASVILKRFEDHQLDNVDITTRELAVIAKSFRETILFHFHARPEYRLK